VFDASLHDLLAVDAQSAGAALSNAAVIFKVEHDGVLAGCKGHQRSDAILVLRLVRISVDELGLAVGYK